MPSIAAGVIIETPPGGSRGSIAVLVEFLWTEVIVPEPEFDAVPEAEPDTDPVIVAEPLAEFELLPLALVDAEPDEDAVDEGDAELDATANVSLILDGP